VSRMKGSSHQHHNRSDKGALEAHDTDGSSPVTKVEAFKRFQENIADRCDEAPVVSSLTEIGSYRVFGGQGGER
jgi:hypothetical protein